MTLLPSRLASIALFTVVAAAPALGQKPWVRPEAPCELNTGHRFVNGAVLQLKQAVESDDPERRDSRLLEARNLLVEAITDAEQAENPAAWYYLGRYYAEVLDAAGADSAFRTAAQLAPECVDDITGYRTPLSAAAMNDAAMAWQAKHIDSAATLFRLAFALDTTDANSLLFLGSMYANENQLDSAAKYVRIGSEVAGDRRQFRTRRQRATMDLARGYENRVAQNPAIARAAPGRQSRDSLARTIDRDSTILANLIAEWSGRNLRPDVRQRVQRDSARVATRLAEARSAHATVTQQARDDSAAAWQALEGVIDVYGSYLESYPDDHDTRAKLISYYATVGHREPLFAAIDELTSSEGVASGTMIQLGLDLLNGGAPEGTARVMKAVIARNGNLRDALYLLARSQYGLRDGAGLMETAGRLVAIDPLNQQSVRMMAAAWELAENRDSVDKYVKLANGGIGWNVTVMQFLPAEASTLLNGSVANITRAARPPMTLTFELLGPGGEVVGSATSDVPALQPGAQHRLTLQVATGGAVAWRYRK